MNLQKIAFVFAFIFISTAVHSQSRDSRKLISFDRIKVFGNINVTLQEGTKEKAEIRVRGLSTEKVITYVSQGLLKVKLQDGNFKDVNIDVLITYRELREITASASAYIQSKSIIKGDKLEVGAGSAGNIVLKVDLNAIDITADTGARIDISGSTKRQNSKVTLGAQLDASKLDCNEAFVKSNTGGQIFLRANKHIDAVAATGAQILYRGNPEYRNVKSSLGGEVIHRH
ncbi:head GIN domain-containing protein [Fulvivirgaceae bacterium BMA10]|uniref:Head GIN domain-containing protein n=1 Tax=Splendidivirga corallicola TaxID=3051826 RepID=A0ABT8KTW9_9BACT|nr:head GIN domain-containing protein [Fulvivirgaceae bacterium BMA10]